MSSIEYVPSAFQSEVHACKAREILAAGSAGPGKSFCLLHDPVITQAVEERARWARGEIEQSDGWSIYFRRTTKRLLETLKRAKVIYPAIFPGIHWDGDNLMFIDPSGYRFQFAHLQHEENADDHRSAQYTAVYFDEATEFTKYQYDIITARVRSSDPVLAKKLRVVLASNPGSNPDGPWLKARFVDPCPQGRTPLIEKVRRKDGTIVEYDRIFIPATLYDNPDKEFVAQYETTLLTKPKHIREAWLNGRWDFFEGAYFASSFNPEIHVVEPFDTSHMPVRFRSMDWGYKTPGVVGWWCADRDGNATMYRELNFMGEDVDQVALKIRAIERENGEWNDAKGCSRLRGPADWQIWEERGNTGPRLVDSFEQHGVYWDKCTKGRKTASLEIVRRLNMPIGGRCDKPNLSFVSTCRKTIEQIASVMADHDDPEEPIKDGSTHWLDQTMYAVQYEGLLAISPKKEDDVFLNWERTQKLAKVKSSRGAWGYGGMAR